MDNFNVRRVLVDQESLCDIMYTNLSDKIVPDLKDSYTLQRKRPSRIQWVDEDTFRIHLANDVF